MGVAATARTNLIWHLLSSNEPSASVCCHNMNFSEQADVSNLIALLLGRVRMCNKYNYKQLDHMTCGLVYN